MTTTDPFDYPDDPPPAPVYDPDSDLPPEPVWAPPDHDDDEAAFWRAARETRPDPPPQPDRRGTDAAEWVAEERRVALTVMCPACKVGIGVVCIRIDTKGPITPPEPLRKLPAHDARIKLARKATA